MTKKKTTYTRKHNNNQHSKQPEKRVQASSVLRFERQKNSLTLGAVVLLFDDCRRLYDYVNGFYDTRRRIYGSQIDSCYRSDVIFFLTIIPALSLFS